MAWNENLHPRDEIGRFTFKDGGSTTTLKGGIEKIDGNSILSNILDDLDIGEIAAAAISVLGKIATPAIKLYSNINDLINLIKINKLEDKFNIALQNSINTKKTNSINNNNNQNKINKLQSNKNIKNTNTTTNNKIKETKINFLQDNKRKSNFKNNSSIKSDKSYRNILINVLDKKLKPSEILYSSTDELEDKVREYGLEERLNKAITNSTNNINSKENNYLLTTSKDNEEKLLDEEIKWKNDEGFKKAMPHLFNREGDYSDHALDKGGKTKYGITEGTLKNYRDNYGKFKDTNIGSLTKEQAAQIYYDEYWKKSGADKIKDKDLAYVHFDATVNHGLRNSRKFLEQSGGDFDKYIEIRRNFYKEIVKNNPNQKVFYNGWMNRLDEIKKNRGKY